MALTAPIVGNLTRVQTSRDSRRLYLPSLVIAAATGVFIWVGVATVVGAGRLGATLPGGWVELAGPLLISMVVVALICKRIWPAQRRPLLARGHLQDACFFLRSNRVTSGLGCGCWPDSSSNLSLLPHGSGPEPARSRKASS